MLCTAKPGGSLCYLGQLQNTKEGGEKMKGKERVILVRSFSNRYGFPLVLVDLREGAGKGRGESKEDYYHELLFLFILSCDSSSLLALSAC